MKVILLEEISSLGKVGDVVKVASGYGRNYLIPQKKALEATPKNIKVWEREKSLYEGKLDRAKREAEKLAEKLESLSCTISKQVGEEDKLFGSVTTMDVEESLKNEGFEIDRKRILLDAPIKKLGIYTIPVKLHSEVTANLKIWVVKS